MYGYKFVICVSFRVKIVLEYRKEGKFSRFASMGSHAVNCCSLFLSNHVLIAFRNNVEKFISFGYYAIRNKIR